MFDFPFPVLLLFIIIVIAVFVCVYVVSILSDRKEVYSVSDPQIVQVGGIQNTDEAVQEGQYDFVDPDINQQNFPAPIGAPVRDVRFQILRFPSRVSTRTVLRELRRNKLSQPTIEVATGMGKKYRYRTNSDILVFLHKPWLRKKDEQVVIALGGMFGNRRIFLTPIHKRVWSTTCGFVGICPEHTPDPVIIMQEEIPPIVYA